MGGVHQHDIQQVRRQAGGDDTPAETLLDKHGDPSGMVDMGVGDEHIVDGVGRKGKFSVGNLIPSLLQTAIHQNPLAIHFQTMAAASHALIGTVKI